MSHGWFPRDMRVAPRLDPTVRPGPVEPRYALLLNPFYPKDPHASFGKHVLTPSLALTSIAAATPPEWEARYWDENLLQGPPPWRPFPEVVGITVHLTFARRANVRCTVIPTTRGNGSTGGGPWSRFSSQYRTSHPAGVAAAIVISASVGVSTCLPKLA